MNEEHRTAYDARDKRNLALMVVMSILFLVIGLIVGYVWADYNCRLKHKQQSTITSSVQGPFGTLTLFLFYPAAGKQPFARPRERLYNNQLPSTERR